MPAFGGSTTAAGLEAVEIDVDVGGRRRCFAAGLLVLLLVSSLSLSGFGSALAFGVVAASSGDLTSLRSGTATSCVGLG